MTRNHPAIGFLIQGEPLTNGWVRNQVSECSGRDPDTFTSSLSPNPGIGPFVIAIKLLDNQSGVGHIRMT